MTFKLSLLLDANAKGAKSELAGTKAAVEGVTTATGKMNQKNKAAAADVRTATSSGATYEQQLKKIASAERMAAKEADAMARAAMKSKRQATAQTANLTAQFNDIGVMMAAGQNPMQLAMQQGTQINQIWQQMGGGVNALKAIGPALMSMVNPMSLLTLGTIAGAAAFTQWITSASDADEVGDKLAKRLEQIGGKLEDANTKLRADLRSITADELTLLDGLAAKEKEIAAQRASFYAGRGIGEIDAARTKALAPLVAEKKALQDQYNELLRIREVRENMLIKTRALSDAERLLGDQMQAALERRRQAIPVAQEMLGTMTEQNAIQAAIIQYGEKSVLVTQLRRDAERGVLEKQLETLDVAEHLKDEIRAAWEEGQTLNATNMSDGIDAAAIAASRVVAEINRAISASQTLSNQGANSLADAKLRLKHANDPVELARELGTQRMIRKQGVRRDGAEGGELAALDAEATSYGNTLAKIARLEKERAATIKATKTSSKSGTSKKGSRAETSALDKLIERQQLQLDILRETDPVQKEMLRNREALADATDAERAAVEKLITERNKEQKSIDLVTKKQELFKDTLYGGFDALVLQGEKLDDVIGNIAKSLIEAAAQAILLGEGPLAGLLGGKSGGGGFIGTIIDAIFPRASAATPAVAMAAQARGTISAPGMSAGQAFAASASSSASTANAVDMRPQIYIQNNSSAQITEEQQDSTDSKGRRRTKLVLADAVGEALTTPGGGANRTMQGRYGLRPRSAQR
jgi:hypothetical protein